MDGEPGYSTRPIQYGLKITFADGTVINWYRDAKRRTVYAERNPHAHALPPSATRLGEIVAAVGRQPAAAARSNQVAGSARSSRAAGPVRPTRAARPARSPGPAGPARPAAGGRETGPPWRDLEGRPVGAFDGGAEPNPGVGGWGVVLPDDRELCGGEPATTNNRMELTGAIRLLEATSGPLRAIGDSRYVIEGITRWIHGWRKRDWRTVTGSPVENQDLWLRLAELAHGREIVWEHVRGHQGHALNERCDGLCRVGRAGGGPGAGVTPAGGRSRSGRRARA